MPNIVGSPDGYVLIDTKLQTGGFEKGAKNLKQQFGALSMAAKKLGGIIAAAFSVVSIASFSKEAIELGSDLQEVQNVVDVTFTTMNEKLNQFAQTAATTAGLSETMAKRFAGTFGAMAKSFRFTEQEAYTMATTLTQLAGDVASFYNLTQDEAYTKLKSVFTGETESLKELGVVMTETALNDFALRKGLGKTVNKMTEQEKVALRYQFVLEQLAGASGDFIRTQDSWANQTRILNLQFEQLKATIGQGLINMLTPVLKLINTLIAKLQQFAVAFKNVTEALFGKATSSGKGIADSLGAAADNSEDLASGITAAGKAAQKAVAGFDEITKLTDTAAGSSAATGGSVGDFDYSLPGVSEQVENQVEQIKEKLQPVIDFIRSVVEKIKEMIEPLKNIDFKAAIEQIIMLVSAVAQFTKEVWDDLEWVWFNILVPLSKWVIEKVTPESIELVTNVLRSMIEAVKAARDGIRNLLAALQPAIDWLKSTAVWVIEKLGNRFQELTTVFKEKGGDISNILSNLGIIFGVLWEKVQPALDKIKKAFGIVFDYIGKVSTGTLGDLISLISGLVQFIAGVLTGDWKKAWEGIAKIFSTIIDRITSNWKSAWQGMAKALNTMIAKIVQGLNGLIGELNKINFKFPDWVPGLGGKSFGLNLKPLTTPQISIPYLAKGAVIPPNAPFYAVLGDQRHGMNIEAPESLIRSIFQEEMANMIGGMMTGFNAMVEEQRNTQEIIRNIEVGDSIIGEAANRYAQKMAIVRGG